jgi:hypothetical protein
MMHFFLKRILLIVIGSGILIQCGNPDKIGQGKRVDVIVYGGTAAGVIAAVQAVRSGKSVVLIAPSRHLGGMTSGGLGFTDTGNKEVIGGLAREFYQRIYQHYDQDENWKWQSRSEYGNKGQGTPAIDSDKRTMWIFEPHAAEKVFEDLVREHEIEVIRDEWLDRENGMEVINGEIRSMRSLAGNQYEARMFIDATYEGDLMAVADVPYHVGRESNATYGETWNGIQTGVLHHGHHFRSDISPYLVPGDPSSGLLPRISADPPGEKGAGDHRVQAYCFRMCLSNHPENRISFTKPDNYDRNEYALLSRVFASGWDEVFHKFDPVPNRKTDTNNHGPFSTDNIGMNYDYPEADYGRRADIIAEHESYQRGLMYFLVNDSTVPSEVRSEMAQWGLAADEFTDTGNWPHQIYVREARRMLGEMVMTELEIMGRRPVARPVGMGSYVMDSHNVQRYIKPDGYVQNEGDIGVKPPQPYQIDYGALIPRKGSIRNLLVPVCLSSSHIAYGSIRMEPVFMILGQSAALAAIQAMDNGQPVQDIDYAVLQQTLLDAGQILNYQGSSKE